MAETAQRTTTSIQIVHGQGSSVLKAGDVASVVENMELTREGSLRTWSGWCPYQVAATSWDDPSYYERMHGVFAGRVGQWDMLLLHTGDAIWEHRGRVQGWHVLIGPAADSPDLVATLGDHGGAQWPTQFVNLGGAVVIIPQAGKGRAYIYDGEKVLPLGYAAIPPPPQGVGPHSKYSSTALTDTAQYLLTNSEGYSHDGTGWTWTGNIGPAGMHPDFGACRRGVFADPLGGSVAGTLEPGQFQAVTQWVDCFGNLSPQSIRSNPVRVDRQTTDVSADGATVPGLSDARADVLLKQILWIGIGAGPDGTVGRNLGITKDTLHSGTTDLFRAPSSYGGGILDFATLPDNRGTVYPDNLGDSWLITPLYDPVPVPNFRLAALAYGRLWIANTDVEPGYLHPSLPRRYGTFLRGEDFLVGEEVTGLFTSPWGLLVFGKTGMWRVDPGEGGTWQLRKIHGGVGCVSPNTIQLVGDGRILVWLHEGGFYAFNGEAVTRISRPIDAIMESISWGRAAQATATVDPKLGYYRCWVPTWGAKECDLCLEWDGSNWRQFTGLRVRASVTTGDHRGYTLLAGKDAVDTDGLWVWGHRAGAYDPGTQTGRVDIGWLRVEEPHAGTPMTVFLWLRENTSADLSVTVFRDWDEFTGETALVKCYPEDAPPAFIGTTALAATQHFSIRRPYWVRVQVYVPACEVFMLRLQRAGNWELIGFRVEEYGRRLGGANTPP